MTCINDEISTQHRLSSLKLKYFWKAAQFGPNNSSIKAQALGDYVARMCSTSAKYNTFSTIFSWTFERVMILLAFNILCFCSFALFFYRKDPNSDSHLHQLKCR